MKKVLLLLLLLLIPLISKAQNATVEIQFALAFSDSVFIQPSLNYIDSLETSYKAIVNENHCSFSIPLKKPALAKLDYNRQQAWIYLEPGYDLNISITTDSLYKAMNFSGSGTESNNFLTSFYSAFQNDFDKDAVKQTILNSTSDAFEMKLYDERKKQMDFYQKADKTNFSDTFKKLMDQNIRYNYFGSLLSYPIINANQSTSILNVNPLPDVMMDGIDKSLFNDDALISPVYREFVYYYVIYFTSKANGFNKFKDQSLSMENKVSTASQNLTPQTLIWYIANFLNNDCDKVAPYTVKHIYGVLKERENNGLYSQLLKTKCEARMSMKEVAVKPDAKPGASNSKNPFDGIKLTDINGKAFNANDIKGKVVYVDYWASWCGPCRQEFPFSKQLHERFTEKEMKQLVFLYISIDATGEAWKNAVQQIGMQGLLLISPGNWGSEIVKYFQISSIPRYMLIDKKGSVNNLNAPRPSSGDEIYNAIEKLLGE